MRLGGAAAYLLDIDNIDMIAKAIAWADERNLPVLMIGSGSNIVWRDEGFTGLVLVNKLTGYEERHDGKARLVTIGAGENWDEAVKRCPSVENIIVVKRTGQPIMMEAGRDHWYHDMCALPIANGKCPTEVMDAEDPLFILYTSGSTGKPKAIMLTHGGYMVGTYATLKYVFDVRDDDRWWCTADPGWITGHSYLVYGPMINGATSFLFEGGPSFPYPNRWWQCIERYGITIFYTAPTAIRGLMRFGEAWPNKHDLSSLRLLGSVGEPINPEAWRWYYRVIGKEKCPIMDTWWQTDTLITSSTRPMIQ